MNTQNCLHCGRYLPQRGWWKTLLSSEPPICNPQTQACWEGFCLRMGVDPETPMPGPEPYWGPL